MRLEGVKVDALTLLDYISQVKEITGCLDGIVHKRE
jgi:hypothetical protein